MTKFSALFAAAALTLTAGLAQADVRPDLIPGLLKSGAIMDLEKLNQAALAQHPGTTAASITDTELEQTATGAYVYQVELRDSKGIEWDVDLDAKTGKVLSNKQDKYPPRPYKAAPRFGSAALCVGACGSVRHWC